MNPQRDRETGDSLAAGHRRFAQRAWIAVTIVAAVFVALFVFWNAKDIILVLFAGLLLAVFLHSISKAIHARTPLSTRAALFVTLLATAVLLTLATYLAAPAISDQAARLGPELQDAIDALEERLSALPISQPENEGGSILQQLLGLSADLFGRVSSLFSTTIGFLTNFVVILFVGIYLAYEPGLYVDGMLLLIPEGRRPRIRGVIREIHDSLRWWLVGRLAMMLVIGLLTTVGLLLLGVPLAMLLGGLAGLLAFIPYFGPLLALAPALLIAFAASPSRALYVLLLYVGVQIVEGYIITPFIEKKVVSLPPVLLIGSQLVLGALLGFWGLLLAPALVVSGRVIVKKLYVEDILGDRSVTYVSDEHGSDE